jgi:hypothetical protein
MDGAGIAAVLALGAQAAQLGTAFVPCAESGASPLHKTAVLAADDDDTQITEQFSGKPARALANRYTREMQARKADHLAFPAQNALTAPLRAAAMRAGKPEFLSIVGGPGCSAEPSASCCRADRIAARGDNGSPRTAVAPERLAASYHTLSAKRCHRILSSSWQLE